MEEKIKTFIKEKIKTILYLIILCCVIFLYNLNFQTINHLLKRGVILEYSIDKNSKINKDDIVDKLLDLNIKYSFISEQKPWYEAYDFEQESVENILYIALSVLPNQDKAKLFNNISDYVFEKYPSSKLINVRSLNSNYNKPWSGFRVFVGIIFLTTLIWYLILYLFFGRGKINK